MILAPGEKVFIMTRRLFREDFRRHFVGEVEELFGGTLRAHGYSFIYDEVLNDFVRREDLRTRLFSAIDAGLMIFVLPAEVVLADVRYEIRKGERLLTDGKAFNMNVSELSAKR
jgi:hypothetical protein